MKAPALIAFLLLALLAAAPVRAAPACADAVVSDWSDGRIDGRYAPRCYGEAIESLSGSRSRRPLAAAGT